MDYLKLIADNLRGIAPGGKIPQSEIEIIKELAGMWRARMPEQGRFADPAWIAAGRKMLGQREIPGSRHNPWIVGFWKRLGASWFNDDETPWCGGYVAWCLNEAGLPYPKMFPRASSFKTYGSACAAQHGAIGVKARKGGNHVFFIVGETTDKLFYKALGGNQGNMVSIMDIKKTDVDAIRWPQGSAQPSPQKRYLPVYPRGVVSQNEQ